MKQGRKISGGRYKNIKKKKFYERQGQEILVKLGTTKRKNLKVRGGNLKTVLISTDEANVTNSKTKKTKKIKIKNVLETPNNVFLARQNILIKGAIIETDLGKARITSRPTQEGSVQAELLDETK